MDINLLQEFVVLAQSETFLKAADILYISQPTLSRHIKNLESELGVCLFERTTRSSKLTKYGYMLLPYAKQMVELHNQFRSELLIEKQEQHWALRIGTVPAMAFYGITEVLTKFKEKYSDIKMDVIPSYTMSVKNMLVRRDCEVAFVREQEFELEEENEDIVRLPLLTDYLVAVVPENHRLAQFESVHISEVKNEDILTISKETIIYEIVSGACERAGFEPNLVLQDHNIDHIIDCVKLGMGVALLMDRHADKNRPQMKNMKVLPVLPTVATQLSLCYLKDANLSDAAQKFIQVYKENYCQ